MSEIDQLKIEAKRLFEEVNNGFGVPRRDRESQFYESGTTLENSFKCRLKELRQRAVFLKILTTPFVHRSQ